MTTLNDTDLTALLDGGESGRVEFKESISGSSPDSIREAICAFANDLPGHGKPGVVVVGVRDDGTVTNLPITDELLLRLADMKTDGNIVPPPTITVERRILNGGAVAVVTAQPSDSPPVRCRGRILTRIGPRRGIATAQDERVLNERRRHGDAPFDIQPVPSSSLSDLDMLRFRYEYLPQAFAPEILDANERSVQEQLAATKMTASADDATPTILGLLVLCNSPQDFLPGAYVQFLRLDGADLSDEIIDSESIVGGISDMLRRLDDKLNAHNRTYVDLTSDRVERRIESYPIAALQQITRNAIMHRTYEATNAPVHVSWFNDRIEISSPGGPFGTVTTDNFGQSGITDYRNPNLAEGLRTLGFVQRFGVGIPTTKRLLRETGLPEPEFNILENHVSVTIRGADRQSGGSII